MRRLSLHWCVTCTSYSDLGEKHFHSGGIRMTQLPLNWLIWVLSKHCTATFLQFSRCTICQHGQIIKSEFIPSACPALSRGLDQNPPGSACELCDHIPCVVNALSTVSKIGCPFPASSGAPTVWSLSQESSVFDFSVLLVSNFRGLNQKICFQCHCF